VKVVLIIFVEKHCSCTYKRNWNYYTNFI